MLNLIKAELYKSNRLGTYVINGVTISIILGLVINEYIYMKSSIYVKPDPYYIGELGIYMAGLYVMVYVPFIFEDFKYEVLKNTESYVYTRTKIFLSKFINQIIMFLITITLSVLVFVVSINLFGVAGNNQIGELKLIIEKILVLMPQYIKFLIIYNAIILLFKSEGLGMFMIIIIYSLVYTVLTNIIESGSIIANSIAPYILEYPVQPVYEATLITKDMILYSFIGGIIEIVIFLGVGIYIFNNKEAK